MHELIKLPEAGFEYFTDRQYQELEALLLAFVSRRCWLCWDFAFTREQGHNRQKQRHDRTHEGPHKESSKETSKRADVKTESDTKTEAETETCMDTDGKASDKEATDTSNRQTPRNPPNQVSHEQKQNKTED